jgi:hypothetical protein
VNFIARIVDCLLEARAKYYGAGAGGEGAGRGEVRHKGFGGSRKGKKELEVAAKV